MSNISFYLAQIFDGIAFGSVYGIFALSLVLLFRANKLFNFGQTEIATFFVMISLVLMKKLPLPAAILTALSFSFIGGALLHFGLMRFVTERKNVLHSSESVLTIGFYFIFNSFSSYLFGDDPRPYPSLFGTGVLNVAGVGISYQSIGILASSLTLVLVIHLIYKHTPIGMVFEAVAENIVGARLRGIRASNVLGLAWGFTIMTATIGGMLLAPVLLVTPSMLVNIFCYALIAVVIGGLESPMGAMVGGIIVGVVENLASNIPFIGSELKFVAVLVLLLVVLLIRPRGIWGRIEARRV
jgi:branched-chain amino acid transport system permease protein